VPERPHIGSSPSVPPDGDQRVARLWQYWRSIHPSAGGLPGRQHVEPLDMADLLAWLWLVDVAREPLRFRFRLVGTGHRRMLGTDVTGRWIDEALPGFEQQEGYGDFIAGAAGQIRYCRRPPEFPLDRSCAAIERILLPLARDGASVDMLLGMTLYILRDGITA
jgi:PAS domain-containing protein